MDNINTLSKVIKGGFVLISAFLADKLGILYPVLLVLLISMIADYISGMIASKYEALNTSSGGWSSKKGLQGIFKKIGYLLAIGCAVIVDYLIYKCAVQIGVNMPANTFFGLFVSIWFILNELLSILENVGRAGTPLPDFLKNIIAILKDKVEGKGEDLLPEDRKEDE